MSCLHAAGAADPAGTHLSHGRFRDFTVYAPASPRSVVLFLSGDGGWDAAAESLTRALVARGAMVAAINFPLFKASLEADGAQCVFPDGDLENLSHFVQAYFHNADYLPPLLAGVGSGAAFAYAVLAQAPGGTFAGALTADFCPRLDMIKPLCPGSGFQFKRGTAAEFVAGRSLDDPWVALLSRAGSACPVDTAAGFVAQVPGGASAILPTLSVPPFAAAFSRLTAADRRPRAAPTALGDLPVVEVPAAVRAAAPAGASPDTFAIIMSGDGGWAGLDKEIAAALSAVGMPVVGLDSLRYYWTPRTPAGLAADTDRMIRYYMARYARSRVLLIGYSQGADVLPFAVNRLQPATHAHVALAAVLGMSEHAVFEFHLSNWISDDNAGPATLPEVDRIAGIPVLCIYGEEETDSLCPQLDAHKIRVVKLKGGHHFDGNYAGLAHEILNAAAALTGAMSRAPANRSSGVRRLASIRVVA